MSQENVEIVRRSARPRPAIWRADAAFWHPDDRMGELGRPSIPRPATLNGRGAVVAYVQDWQTTMPGMSFDTKRVVETGNAVVSDSAQSAALESGQRG